MRVLFVTAEAAPFGKVGGLADVAAALPSQLRADGHDVRVVTPCHSTALSAFSDASERPTVEVPDLGSLRPAELATVEGDGGVPTMLMLERHYFGRHNVYGEADDLLRYQFFCRAVAALLQERDWAPDILHLNDWHTASLAFAVRNMAWADPRLRGIASVLTIHNLRYRGPDAFNDFLAQGIYYSDAITTVSPTYAREMLTPELGEGLDDLLKLRGDVLTGILNGIDHETYDPATDSDLRVRFGVDALPSRAANVAALREEAGLSPANGPVLGVVTRLTEQKGIDLVIGAAPAMLARGAQLVVLGQGDHTLVAALRALEVSHPGAVKLFDGFDEGLARRIYAGTDMFLMPSRFEPCGLGQLIAMRYGSVPLGRRTGGIADTVLDPAEHAGDATGFLFDDFTQDSLMAGFERALAAFGDAGTWRMLQENGMRCDTTWGPPARRYVEVYEAALRAHGAE